jgi:hypothetical protein
MEPLLVNTGVATAEETGMETFKQRPRDEWEVLTWGGANLDLS